MSTAIVTSHRSTRRRLIARAAACMVALVLVATGCGSAADDEAQQVIAQGQPAGEGGTGQSDDGQSDDGRGAPPATTEPVLAPTPTAAAPEATEPDSAQEPPSTEAPAEDDGDQADEPAAEAPPAPTPTPIPARQDPTPTPSDALGDEPIPVEMPDLIGRDWFVVAVEPSDPPRPTGAVARVRFSPDGTVSGNAGCNDFGGSYTIDGAGLSIGNLAITERACLIGDWSAFVQALPAVTGFGSAGGPDPILFTTNGSIALGSTPPGGPTGPAEPNPGAVDQYIGLSEIEAAQLADANGVAFRVASIDGEPQMLTMDYVADRVNVDLVAGVVVGATLG